MTTELMTITNRKEMDEAFRKLNAFIKEGFEGNPEKEAHFLQLAKAIEAYEDSIPLMPFREPQTIPEMLRQIMFDKYYTQKELAALLEVSQTRLSEVMNGKRKVNMELAKKLHDKLNIRADFLLETA
jgi:HTH-type transcriptional regulator / antitoxin HigA